MRRLLLVLTVVAMMVVATAVPAFAQPDDQWLNRDQGLYDADGYLWVTDEAGWRCTSCPS